MAAALALYQVSIHLILYARAARARKSFFVLLTSYAIYSASGFSISCYAARSSYGMYIHIVTVGVLTLVIRESLGIPTASDMHNVQAAPYKMVVDVANVRLCDVDRISNFP